MEIDDNPFTYLVFHSNGSSMIFNNFLADGKSEPGVGMLGGEKGIENIVESCASGSYACAYHVSKKTSNRSFLIINNGEKIIINIPASINTKSIIRIV